jgi:hypothetical protein
MNKRNKPFFPIGIGFIGMAIPLFISIIYAPDNLTKIIEIVGGFIFLILGFFTISYEEKEDKEEKEKNGT